MYKSPIELLFTDIHHQIIEQQDEEIYKAVLHFVPNVDKAELLKALHYDRGQYDKGYADGTRDAEQKWIPVTERLPEMHKVVYEDRCEPSGQGSYLISHTVLVYSDDGTIGTGTYEEGVTIGWNADTGSDNVTHWMPLPEPPKGE